MIHFTREKLSLLMEIFGLKQKDIARMTGFSNEYISKLVLGREPMRRTVQVRLNKVYQEMTDEALLLEDLRRKKLKFEGDK